MLTCNVATVRRRRLGILLLVGLSTPAVADRRASQRPVPSESSFGLAGAGIAWQIHIPQRSIDSIRHFHLVDEYIYGFGSNGWVWAIDARTGERVWSRELVYEGYTLWPPVSGRRYQEDTVAFTRLMDLSLVHLEDGMEVLNYRLAKPSSGPTGLTRDLAISSEVDRRIRAYDLDKGYTAWMVDSKGALNLPPLVVSAMREAAIGAGSPLVDLFAPDETIEDLQERAAAAAEPEEDLEFAEIFYFADSSGQVGAGYASDKRKLFLTRVEGRPEGGLAADDQHLYVATSQQWLYALDRLKGTVTWRRRLLREPEGRPILTRQSLYIGLRGGGVERFDFSGDYPESVLLDECRRFLAEWPTRVAMLDNDGRVTFFQKSTWERGATLEPGQFELAISNPLNDAVFVGTKRGDLLCIRPVNSSPLPSEAFISEDLKKALANRAEVMRKQDAKIAAEGESAAAGAPESPPEETVQPERFEDRILTDPLRSRRR